MKAVFKSVIERVYGWFKSVNMDKVLTVLIVLFVTAVFLYTPAMECVLIVYHTLFVMAFMAWVTGSVVNKVMGAVA